MNRYKIKGTEDKFIQVEFYGDHVVNMKGLCTIHINEKEFDIPVDLLKEIAEPAP